MPRLVALTVTPGPAYRHAIERVWSAGDAFAPIDHRLPPAELDRVMVALRPGALLGDDGEIRPLAGGLPVDHGDALVLATSGTSGRPKGVVHTHGSIEASARATSAMLGVDPSTDRWLACLPLAHIGGLSVVLRAMVTGTPVEIQNGFDRAEVVDAADRGATLVSLVTRALRQIDAQRFRAIVIGGASAPADLPINVVATYGMTETGSGVVYRTAEGQRRLDGVEIRIDDDGQVLLRGPMLLRCYRDGTMPFDADGWFPTGDLGSLDVDGRLQVDGRAGDVINTGAEKVWPGPIEEWLTELDTVAQAAVVGVPDPEWGQRVVAVIVPSDAACPPDLATVKSHVRQRFAPWAAPREVVLVESLPRTSLGKVKRTALVSRLAAEVDSQR